MPRPPRRPLHRRKSDNEKRRLWPDPPQSVIERMLNTVWYHGSSKHKLHPHLFDLPPFLGSRGDATLCDDADFDPDDMKDVPMLLRRGIRAGLIGHTGRLLWTVADDGWIFEARETNHATGEYHGYPVLRSEAIAQKVFRRFSRWANAQGDATERSASAFCKLRYVFR